MVGNCAAKVSHLNQYEVVATVWRNCVNYSGAKVWQTRCEESCFIISLSATIVGVYNFNMDCCITAKVSHTNQYDVVEFWQSW